MAPNGAGRIFPTSPDLADILGRTDFDFENFYFFGFFGLPTWARLGPRLGPGLGPSLDPPRLGPGLAHSFEYIQPDHASRTRIPFSVDSDIGVQYLEGEGP